MIISKFLVVLYQPICINVLVSLKKLHNEMYIDITASCGIMFV